MKHLEPKIINCSTLSYKLRFQTTPRIRKSEQEALNKQSFHDFVQTSFILLFTGRRPLTASLGWSALYVEKKLSAEKLELDSFLTSTDVDETKRFLGGIQVPVAEACRICKINPVPSASTAIAKRSFFMLILWLKVAGNRFKRGNLNDRLILFGYLPNTEFEFLWNTSFSNQFFVKFNHFL